jgi:SIR2-like domain
MTCLWSDQEARPESVLSDHRGNEGRRACTCYSFGQGHRKPSVDGSMIDPLISLAFAVSNSPGIYALLLGSGISRAAAIPTGWEVLVDLTRKLAAAMNETADPDPAGWFRSKFNAEPNYSDLLNKLAKLPTERAALLRQYFEPTEEERSRGLKVPTKAHRAIASLVAAGYLRVLVTTNFDRLLETVLTEAGVVPTVISTADAALGALPLIHNRCTVLKLHGDYLDSRIKNTAEELSNYEPPIGALLDRILDEFGLIVCGWSAEWDTALFSAVERMPNRRFTTYWAARGALRDRAKRLVELRRAEIIQITDADSFFSELSQKVSALADFRTPHPLSVAAAVEMLKKFLPRPEFRIAEHDLMVRETERCRTELAPDRYPLHGVAADQNFVARRLGQYEAATAIVRRLLSYGMYWRSSDFAQTAVTSLTRIASLAAVLASGSALLLRLRSYPASTLFCASSLGAVACRDYKALRQLFEAEVPHQTNTSKKAPAVLELFPGAALPEELLKVVNEAGRTPASDHVFALLRDDFRELLPDDDEYSAVFDRFEYLISLVNIDLKDKRGSMVWAPTGRFYFHSTWEPQSAVIDSIDEEAAAAGPNWAPLQAGFFGGSQERLKEVAPAYRKDVLAKISWY